MIKKKTKHNSNTTLVKVKYKTIVILNDAIIIQIQLLLKLNPDIVKIQGGAG